MTTGKPVAPGAWSGSFGGFIIFVPWWSSDRTVSPSCVSVTVICANALGALAPSAIKVNDRVTVSFGPNLLIVTGFCDLPTIPFGSVTDSLILRASAPVFLTVTSTVKFLSVPLT
jgi:hypothetical protein